MYKYPVLLLVVISCLGCNGQVKKTDNAKPQVQSLDATINDIRKEFTLINSGLNKMLMKEKDLEDVSTEGGELKKYFDSSGALRKLVVVFYGEIGKRTEEYYVKNNNLFFAFYKEDHYSRPVSPEGVKVESTMEQRFYFNSQKLIRMIDPEGAKVDSPSTRLVAKEKEVLKNYNEFLTP